MIRARIARPEPAAREGWYRRLYDSQLGGIET